MRAFFASIVGVGVFSALVACGNGETGSGGASTGATTTASSTTGAGGAASDPPDVALAIATCYEALHGDTSKRAAGIAALEQATMAHPDNGRAFLFLGMCSLSALAEDNDLTALAKIEPALTKAIQLLPDDRRIPGWLATVRVQKARIAGTQAEVDAAVAEMIAAADLYPEFNNVSLAIAFAGFPLSTPYPQMAAQRLEAIKNCGQTDPKCGDEPQAPHNVPGSGMLFGDIYARVGDKAKALSYYQAALAAPSATGWGYAPDAQAMSSGIDARIADWTDADTTNDPAFFLSGKRTCTGCHQ